MLNELFQLTQNQRNAGITNKESWHGQYKELPKGTTIRALFDQNGKVSDIEVIADRTVISAIRKYEIANGQSFPAFNIKPLFRYPDDAQKEITEVEKRAKSGASVKQDLERIITKSERFWDDREKRRVGKCLELAGELGKKIGEPSEECRSIAVLAERVAISGPDVLFAGIMNGAINAIERGNDTKTCLRILFHTGAKQSPKICVVCDLYNRSAYPYPPTHDKVQQWVNQKLVESGGMQSKRHSGQNAQDAFGMNVTGQNEKFPAAKMPRLGKVILRAMNSESPCQKRYGRADAESFCVSKGTRQQMKDSLEWLGKEARKNETWCGVAGACGYTKRDGRHVPVEGVLFAYPSIATISVPWSALFAGEDSPSDPDGSLFAATAKRVVDGLRGILRKRPDATIHVFVLAKADKARTKLLLSKRYDAQHVLDAAGEWKNGCLNLPDISLNIGTDEANKGTWIKPFMPFPAEVVKCLNVAWHCDGTRTSQVSSLNIGEGIALLTEKSPTVHVIAGRELGVLLRNSSTLLLALAHSDHRRDASFTWGKETQQYKKYAFLLPSILGLLLYKLGYQKGDYMHTAPFLIGQLMSLADTLHKEYCLKVRSSRGDGNPSEGKNRSPKAGLPRQLIGNAAMSIAMENPAAGLARLSERILIYQAWANTASGDIGYAGWALREYRRLAEELAVTPIHERTTDMDKAQLLLGYMSRIGSDEDSKNNVIKKESETGL